MKKLVFIFLLLFIVLSATASIIAYQKGFPTKWAKERIIALMEQGMNIHVQIDDIAFGFPNRLIINGLRINRQVPVRAILPEVLPSRNCLPLIKVKQLIIKCRLRDIILRKHPSSYGIDRVIMNSPELYLFRSRDGVWNIENIGKPYKPSSHSPPEFFLFTKNGRIILQDDMQGTSTVLSKIMVNYSFGKFKAKALAGGIEPESLTPLHCFGTIHAVSPINMSWGIEIKKANLSRYASYLNLPFGQVLDGDIQASLKGRAACFGTETGRGQSAVSGQQSAVRKTETAGGAASASGNISKMWTKIGEYTIYGISGQVGVQDGRFLLKNARLPFNQINGTFRLTSDSKTVGAGSKPAQIPENVLPVTTLKACPLRAVMCDAEVKATVVVPDINNPETLIQFSTSRCDAANLRYLTNISSLRDYFSRLKFRTSLQFNGKIVPSPFTISGRLKTNNFIGKEKFPAEAGFIFRDDVFDSVDINIDGKTKLNGKVSFLPERPSDFVVTCCQSRAFPLLGLFGVKAMSEIEKGNISGKLRMRGNNYEGNLTLDTHGLFQKAVLNIKPQGIEAIITQSEGGKIVANCQLSPSLKIDASVHDFIYNQSKYSLDAALNTDRKIMLSNVIINQTDYPPWHGGVNYDNHTLKINSALPQPLLINGVIDKTGQIDMDIAFERLRLNIIHPAVNGNADGKIQLRGNIYKRLSLSGEGIQIRDSLLSSNTATANLSLIKRENMLSIPYLSFAQDNSSVYISGLINTSNGALKSASLNAQINNLLLGNVRATTTVKYNGQAVKGAFKGSLVCTSGNINNINISSGRIEIKQTKNGNIFSGNIHTKDTGVLACSGQWDTNSIIGEFTLNNMNLAKLPFDYFNQWQGNAFIQGKIEGQIKNPRISANFTSSGLKIGSKEVKTLSGNLYYASHRLSVDANFDDELFFFGMLDEEIKARVRIEKGRLSLLSRVLGLPPVRLDGLINGELSLTGKRDNPLIEGDVTVEGFESYGVFADIIKVKVNIKDKVFSTTQLYAQQGKDNQIVIEKCMIDLVPDGRISFEARANSFQVANITLSGIVSCNGSITVGKSASVMINTGNIVINDSYDLKNLAFGVRFLTDKSLEFINSSAENSIMGRVRMDSKDKVIIDNFSLFRQGRKILSIDGWINLAAKDMDVGIVMDKADLTLLSLYVPTIKKAEGIVNGGLHFGGQMNDPVINGSLKFSGALNTYPFAARVRELNGTIHVVNNSIILQNLSASIGKGRLIAASKGAFTLADMNISIRTEDSPIPILIPDFIESHGRYGGIELDMNISGAVSSPLTTGQIYFINTDFTYPPKKTKDTPIGFFDKMRWDIVITGKDNIRYYNDFVSIYLKKNACLRVVKDDEQLNITGKVFARGGGIIDYLGTEFILKDGLLEFREGEPVPYLSACAWARLDKRKIILSHHGYLSVGELVLSATGYPPLSQEEIIKLLINRSSNYSTLSGSDLHMLFDVAGGQILGKGITDALLVPIERRISRLLRINLSVKTPVVEEMLRQAIFAEGTSTLLPVFANTTIKIGKFISENLYISYKGVLNPYVEEGDDAVNFRKMRLANEIGLEYYMSGNTTIKYKFIPRYNQLRDEYEVSMERGFRF